MNVPAETTTTRRNDAWLAAIVVAFILGFLLAWWLWRRNPVEKPVCPRPAKSATAAAARTAQAAQGGGGKPGAPGQGSPTKPNGGGSGDSHVAGNGTPANADGGAPAGGNGSGSGKVSGGGSYDVSGNTIVNNPPGAAHTGAAPDDSPSAGGGSGNGDIQLPPANGSAGGDHVVNITPGTGHFNGKPGNGEMDAGGGGKAPQGDAQSQPSPAGSTPHALAGDQPTKATPGGTLQSGPPAGDSDPGTSKPANKVVTALDYRYDKSGLPHYPNAIKVASGTDAAAAAAAAGPIGKDYSITEIVTDDPPDVAAAWYHDHLPAGWNELQMPSALAMNQAIAQTKTPQPGQSPVDSMLNVMIAGPQLQAAKPSVDAARAAGLTIFQPADQNTDHRMILVIRDSKTGKTGILLMKKADTQ